MTTQHTATPDSKDHCFRDRIYDSVTDTIGATPMVRLARFAAHHSCPAEILAKLEFFNPLSSVKDRIGLAMIEAAEQAGQLKPGGMVIEPTSGNTGIALAFVCAARGYKLVLTMPESMSMERRKMLRLLGAELRLTEAARGMRGAIDEAEKLRADNPGAIILQQFENPANPSVHSQTTAEEIRRDCANRLDVVIGGIGTGGTLTGLGRTLRPLIPHIKIVAVEPEDSPVLSGGPPGPHKIQGIGAGFIPQNADTTLLDDIIRIGNETAFATARAIAKIEGLPVGISSGAALAAALEIGKKPDMDGKRIVVIIPSSAERYLSTDLFKDV